MRRARRHGRPGADLDQRPALSATAEVPSIKRYLPAIR
jgi:hypothetical protein